MKIKTKQSESPIIQCKSGCTKCELCSKIDHLTRSEIKLKIDDRIQEFKGIDKKNKDSLFIELCFCILTANFNAVRSIKIQEELGTGFITLSQEKLAKKLKELGYRFPNTRAQYIFESRKWYQDIVPLLFSFSLTDQRKLRDWLAKNVKGIGLKEGSHFLRNIGYDNCAIIDFHIVDLLVDHSLIERPKTLTKSMYQEIEQKLQKIADLHDLTLAELDLYLWFLETGQILK